MIRGLVTASALAFALVAPMGEAGAQELGPPPPAPAPALTEPASPPPAPALSPERFAPEIAHFAELDAASPPPACPFLFVGSSSIRFWRSLEADMAPFPVINRGFGGSRIADVDFYFDRVVAPYHPRAIFFYAGENDLWAGEPPDTVVADFERFLTLKTKALGETPVYFISLKPSRQRLSQLVLQGEVNARIRAMTEQRTDLHYVDVVPTMLDQGAPKDIYVADGLHMTPDGYLLWTGVLRPVVEQEAQLANACAPPAINATP